LPIRFISKALHRPKLNLSTFEKKAFAIFYILTKFDFLLRDVRFVVQTDHKNLTLLKTTQSAKVRRWQLTLQELDFRYIHIKGSIIYTLQHHLVDEVAIPERLTALLMSSSVSGTKEPTIEPRPTVDNSRPLTTEPAIEPKLRAKIEAAQNSVSGHFGVEYRRKVLLGRKVNDEGLRRIITKFVRDCPVCQLRSVLNIQIKTHRFTTASYTPMEVLNIDTIGPVSSKDSADNCYILYNGYRLLYSVSGAFSNNYYLHPTMCARAIKTRLQI
jgi:hypothetical protein